MRGGEKQEWGWGPQVKKFEEVRVVGTWGTPMNRHIDRHDYKHYLPAASLVVGNQFVQWKKNTIVFSLRVN